MLSAALLPGQAIGRPATSATGASLRGLSVVSDRVAWASGTGGTWLRTIDGGGHWHAGQVPGAAALDFRGVAAFSAQLAYVMSSGSGASSRIYKTVDGGRHWQLQWQAGDAAAFLDGLAFWDADHGLALSDPVRGRFLLLATADGGRHWRELRGAMPAALAHEGAFAASNSCLVARGGREAWFVTGGAAAARIFRSQDGGLSWRAAPVPLPGGPATGVFSLAFCGARQGALVGGNYQMPRQARRNAAYTRDGGRTWLAAQTGPPDGYMSAVACAQRGARRNLVAVGPLGTDVSQDGGRTWRRLSAQGFNVLAFAPSGRVAFAAGASGRLGVLTWAATAVPHQESR